MDSFPDPTLTNPQTDLQAAMYQHFQNLSYQRQMEAVGQPSGMFDAFEMAEKAQAFYPQGSCWPYQPQHPANVHSEPLIRNACPQRHGQYMMIHPLQTDERPHALSPQATFATNAWYQRHGSNGMFNPIQTTQKPQTIPPLNTGHAMNESNGKSHPFEINQMKQMVSLPSNLDTISKLQMYDKVSHNAVPNRNNINVIHAQKTIRALLRPFSKELLSANYNDEEVSAVISSMDFFYKVGKYGIVQHKTKTSECVSRNKRLL